MKKAVLLSLLVVLTAAGFRAEGPEPEAQVRAAMVDWLAARFPDRLDHLDVRVLRLSAGAEERLTASSLPLRLDLPRSGTVPEARAQVSILTGSDASGWEEIGWAMLYVAHFDSVLLPVRTIPEDEPLDAGAVRTAWIETTTLRTEPLAPAAFREMLAGGEVFAARRLREGHPLRDGDVRPPYAATIGEAVRMHYRRGRIELVLSCKARETGFTGDAIRLYAPGTQTTYRARLTAPGQAEWIETL